MKIKCTYCHQENDKKNAYCGCCGHALPQSEQPATAPVESPSTGCVFSGDASKPLWDQINALDGLSTGDDIREVLYSFGCAMQELEAKLTHNNNINQREIPQKEIK